MRSNELRISRRGVEGVAGGELDRATERLSSSSQGLQPADHSRWVDRRTARSLVSGCAGRLADDGQALGCLQVQGEGAVVDQEHGRLGGRPPGQLVMLIEVDDWCGMSVGCGPLGQQREPLGDAGQRTRSSRPAASATRMRSSSGRPGIRRSVPASTASTGSCTAPQSDTTTPS